MAALKREAMFLGLENFFCFAKSASQYGERNVAILVGKTPLSELRLAVPEEPADIDIMEEDGVQIPQPSPPTRNTQASSTTIAFDFGKIDLAPVPATCGAWKGGG